MVFSEKILCFATVSAAKVLVGICVNSATKNNNINPMLIILFLIIISSPSFKKIMIIPNYDSNGILTSINLPFFVTSSQTSR